MQLVSQDLRQAIENAASVLKAEGAREVYIFGSTVSGRLRTDSDVDMVVSGLAPRVFFRAMSRAGDALGRPLDLVDLDEESPFARRLRAQGELVRVG